MRLSGSVGNRVVLLGGGLVLLAAGAALVATGLESARLLPAGAAGAVSAVERASADASAATVDLGSIGEFPLAAVSAAAAALVVVVLLIAFLLTRGRGRVREVLAVPGPRGTTRVDRGVADGVLAETLAARADVVSARTVARRAGRRTALGLVVTPRKGAALGAVVAAAEAAVAEWDRLLGVEVPVVVHVADRGWRELFRSRQRMRRSLAGAGEAGHRSRTARTSSTPRARVA
ncbi:hypothetical protein [Microbacterium sufflavum]